MHSREIRFLHLTDTHIRSDTQLIRNVNSTEAVNVIGRSHRQVYDCVIHTGDLVSRPADEASYRHYNALISSFPWPVYHIPGNHDDSGLMHDCVAGAAVAYPWVAVVQGVRFIGVDSSTGAIDPEQLTRLEELLYDPQPAVLCLHHHFLAIDESWLNPYCLENRLDFMRVIDGARTPIFAILHGHTHYHDERNYNAIPVLSAGACAAGFDPFGEFQALSSDPPSVTECRIHADGSVSRERIFLNNTHSLEGSL